MHFVELLLGGLLGLGEELVLDGGLVAVDDDLGENDAVEEDRDAVREKSRGVIDLIPNISVQKKRKEALEGKKWKKDRRDEHKR